jgi:DNA-binding FrmR family transcriptional regulator
MERTARPEPAKPEAAKPELAQRPAIVADAATRERNLKRLRRIEGQLRGLQGMVEKQRDCTEILAQIVSVHEALRAVARELMRTHLKHSAARAIRGGTAEANAMYDELIELMHKYSR